MYATMIYEELNTFTLAEDDDLDMDDDEEEEMGDEEM